MANKPRTIFRDIMKHMWFDSQASGGRQAVDSHPNTTFLVLIAVRMNTLLDFRGRCSFRQYIHSKPRSGGTDLGTF